MGNVTGGGVNDGDDDENEFYEDGTENSSPSGSCVYSKYWISNI